MVINDVLFNCELSDILDEVDAQRSIYGLSPFKKRRNSGKDIQVCCPYHNDKRPSAGIRKSDGMFHCFGCGETHTLQELISYVFERYDDTLGKFGWQWLLKNFATMQVEDRKPIELNITRGQKKKIEEQTYVSEGELDSYRYYHPYWSERGITDERIIELFDLGYSPKEQMITFPVRDVNGNCLFVAKRSVNTKFFHYPEGALKPLYGLYEYYHNKNHLLNMYCGQIDFRNWSDELIVCESMLDALAFWVAGRFAGALNGLGNDLQMKQLRELPCRKLILATDNDKRGLEARERIRQNVKNKLITECIFPTDRKDANECLIKDGVESLQNLQEIF